MSFRPSVPIMVLMKLRTKKSFHVEFDFYFIFSIPIVRSVCASVSIFDENQQKSNKMNTKKSFKKKLHCLFFQKQENVGTNLNHQQLENDVKVLFFQTIKSIHKDFYFMEDRKFISRFSLHTIYVGLRSY